MIRTYRLNWPIIGLAGKAGCGKDTAASLLAKHLECWVVALADPIKEALDVALSFPPGSWNDREWKERTLPGLDKSPRFLVQTLGTEWGRQIVHRDIWLWAADQRIEALQRDKPRPAVIVTDIRFPNEVDWLRAKGGIVIEIIRPDVTSIDNPTHVSESGMGHDPDIRLFNTEDLAAFEVQLVATLLDEAFTSQGVL